MSALPNEPTPEFNARCGSILDEWESGALPFKDAVDRMSLLGQEASQRGCLPDQGRVELLLGIMQGYRANLDASIRHFERARDFFERAGNRRRSIGALLNLGESYRLKGNFTRARQLFRAAYDGSKDLQAIDTMTIASYNEGLMLFSMNHPESAKTLLDKALTLVAQLPDDSIDKRIELTCEIQASLAELHLKLMKPDEAWNYALAAYNLAREIQQPLQFGSSYRALGQVITVLRGVPEGVYPPIPADPDEHFRLATEAFQEIKADGEVARTMYLHALSLAERNRGMTAARKLQQAMIIFTRLGMADDAAKAAHAQMEVLATTTQQIG